MRQQNAANVQVSTDGISVSQPVTSLPVLTSLPREVTFFCPECNKAQEILLDLFWQRGNGEHRRFLRWHCDRPSCKKKKPHWANGCESDTSRTAALLHG